MNKCIVLSLAAKVKGYLDSGNPDYWVYGQKDGVMRLDGVSFTRIELDTAFLTLGLDVKFKDLSISDVLDRTTFHGVDGENIGEVVAIEAC